MVSSEKWQKRVSYGLLALIGLGFIIMAWDGMRYGFLTVKGAWAVGMVALFAIWFTIRLGSSLQNWELKRHVLDLTAHPGGLEAMNQDLEKAGNILVEQREILSQIPDLRSRIEHLESWEADLSKGAQAHVQIEKVNKAFSELSIATTSRCEGLAGSLRELRNKVVDLESARQRLAELEKLAGQLVAMKEAMGRLASLPEQLVKVESAASQAASLTPEVESLKEGLAALSGLPEDLRKSAEQFAERCSSLAAQSASLSQEVAALKDTVTKLASLPEQVANVAELKEGVAPLADLPEKLDKLAEQSAERSAALAEDLARVKQQLEHQKKLAESVEKLQAEVSDLSGLSGEIGKLQQQSEKFGEAAAKAEEVVAKLADVEGLKAQVAELAKVAKARPVAARAEGGAQAAVDNSAVEALVAEVAEMKKVVEQLQAEQPNLDVNIKEAKLVTQQDRTVIVCTLTVRNLSNKPNEITAVRAELDSGRNRMAPTAVRHWLPDGKQTNEERLILLPQKVLEKSTTAPITLTAIGWPLEKTQGSYAFRITLRDKNGNEYVRNHQLVPEPATTK